MSGLLDIGTLTGAVELDSRLDRTIDQVINKVDDFSEQFLGRFKGVATAVGVVGTAILGIAGTISTLATKGSEVNDVEGGFSRLAGSVENADAILRAMRGGVANAISDMNLMTTANKLLSSEVKANAADFGTLTQASRVLANQGLGSLEGILSQVTRALQTGSTHRLKQLGIEIDLSRAEREYASRLGTTASALTATQSLEAKRNAILEASRKLVEDAGAQQLSFADRVAAAYASLSNWTNELMKNIAASPSVLRAYDTIKDAIGRAFGGDSRNLMDWVLKWTNRFADAVTTYGPTVIEFFGKVKDFIVGVYTTVTDTWNALPDWLKTVAKDAAVTWAALYVGGKAMDVVADRLSRVADVSDSVDWIGTGSGIATMLSGFHDYAKWMGGPLIDNMGKAKDAVDRIREGIYRFESAKGIAASTFGQFAAGAIVVASVTAVVTAGYNAWKLYSERQEQARTEAIRTAQAQTNLQQINKALGKNFTDLGAAMEFVRERNRQLAEARKNSVQATEAQKLAEEQYKKALEQSTDALTAAATKTSLLTGMMDFMLQKGNERLLYSREAQDIALKEMETQLALGRYVSQTALEQGKAWQLNRRYLQERKAEELSANGVTAERIAALRNQGLSEAMVAKQIGATVEEMKYYEATVIAGNEHIRQSNEKLLQMQEDAHGLTINEWIAREDRKYKETIRAAQMANKATIAFLEKEKEVHDAVVAAEIKSRLSQMENSREWYLAQAEEAERRYNDMLAHQGSFAASAIRMAAQEANEKRRLANYWYVDATEKAEATEKANAEAAKGTASAWNSTTAATSNAAEGVRQIGHAAEETQRKVETTAQALARMSGNAGQSYASNLVSPEVYEQLTEDQRKELSRMFKSASSRAMSNAGSTRGFVKPPDYQRIAEGWARMNKNKATSAAQRSSATEAGGDSEPVMVPGGSAGHTGPVMRRGGVEMGHQVIVQKGAVQINNPLMRDKAQSDQYADAVGGAIMEKMRGKGTKFHRRGGLVVRG